MPLWCLELGFLLFLSLRFGLFAASLFSALSLLIDQVVLTHDFSASYRQGSLVATLVLATVAFYGFHTALGGRPLASLPPPSCLPTSSTCHREYGWLEVHLDHPHQERRRRAVVVADDVERAEP